MFKSDMNEFNACIDGKMVVMYRATINNVFYPDSYPIAECAVSGETYPADKRDAAEFTECRVLTENKQIQTALESETEYHADFLMIEGVPGIDYIHINLIDIPLHWIRDAPTQQTTITGL